MAWRVVRQFFWPSIFGGLGRISATASILALAGYTWSISFHLDCLSAGVAMWDQMVGSAGDIVFGHLDRITRPLRAVLLLPDLANALPQARHIWVLVSLYLLRSVTIPLFKADEWHVGISRTVTASLSVLVVCYWLESVALNVPGEHTNLSIVAIPLTGLLLYGSLNGVSEAILLARKNWERHGTSRIGTVLGHAGAALRRNGSALIIGWILLQAPTLKAAPGAGMGVLALLVVINAFMHLREGWGQRDPSFTKLRSSLRSMATELREGTTSDLPRKLESALSTFKGEREQQVSPSSRKEWSETDGFAIGATMLCPLLLAGLIISLDQFVFA